MKRLMIYFFYDKDGIVDDYVPYFLEKFKPYCEEICTVVNGTVTEESRKKLEKYSNVVFERENTGFDSGAYKYGIKHYGYEKLKEYDELILANFTMFGPIYSPQEMFDSMEKRDCDFWGITKHPANKYSMAGIKVYEHVQSYFLVYNKKLLNSKDFEIYWETLQTATNYEEAVAFHELRTTSFFESKGYKYDTFINFEKYISQIKDKEAYFYPLIQQIKEDRMPFIKRKIFQCSKCKLCYNIKGGIVDLLTYVKEHTDYDLKLIWNNILRGNYMEIDSSYVRYQYYRCSILRFILLGKRKHYENKVANCKNQLKLIDFIEKGKLNL